MPLEETHRCLASIITATSSVANNSCKSVPIWLVLQALGTEFETADVLTDDEIRQGIKDYSNWPTIPQLYIDGEFVGGSDIMMEMYQNGELKTKLDAKSGS